MTNNQVRKILNPVIGAAFIVAVVGLFVQIWAPGHTGFQVSCTALLVVGASLCVYPNPSRHP